MARTELLKNGFSNYQFENENREDLKKEIERNISDLKRKHLEAHAQWEAKLAKTEILCAITKQTSEALLEILALRKSGNKEAGTVTFF